MWHWAGRVSIHIHLASMGRVKVFVTHAKKNKRISRRALCGDSKVSAAGKEKCHLICLLGHLLLWWNFFFFHSQTTCTKAYKEYKRGREGGGWHQSSRGSPRYLWPERPVNAPTERRVGSRTWASLLESHPRRLARWVMERNNWRLGNPGEEAGGSGE